MNPQQMLKLVNQIQTATDPRQKAELRKELVKLVALSTPRETASPAPSRLKARARQRHDNR